MARIGYNPKRGRIKTDASGATIDRGFIAHFEVSPVAVATDAVHEAVACSTPAKAAKAIVKAASDDADTLTITAPAALGAAANALNVLLLTAGDDSLAVAGDDETATITISLADTTAAKNKASAIQTAVRALAVVAGVDVSGFTAGAGGSWDSAAIATGETDAVPFTGGQTAAPDVLDEGLTNPDVPRNITATAGGTAGDVAAVQVKITGTNYAGESITEELPAFTVNTAGTVAGSLAFRTVTKVEIPAHDGTGATTKIGWGDKLGLPYRLPHNTVLMAFVDGTKEGTPPTVAADPDDLAANTFKTDTDSGAADVDLYLIV